MNTPIYSCHPKALGAPTFATAAAAPRSCLRSCLTPCAPSASSSAGRHGLETNVTMNTAGSNFSPTLSSRRYSAKQTLHHVDFFCDAPTAQTVQLGGDFNGWKPSATPMRRMPDGRWMASLELHHGHHRYIFIVDGEPMLDPKANGIVRDDQNNRVSLIAVS